ncbi:MAG: flagellar hook-length control protein FliK [Proteobacteria bacterium]|nr:flagellar hook-length control protein FliK [Pseudomonadota bacterium]MBU1611295.1 flagellar hook-length control protein FliK [Pseudomonadota bacterium]
MQDIPAIESKSQDSLDLLGHTSWDTGSIDQDVFAGFLDYQANIVRDEKAFAPAPVLTQPLVQSVTTATDLTNKTMPESAQTVFESKDTLKDMKNVPVDNESFQAMKPQLEKYGLNKEEIKALEDKVNSEEGMTWGNLVTFISAKMAEVSKATELSAEQRQKLMTFFQKLGFSAPESERMVGDLALGKTDQVMQAVNKQLTTLPQDKLAGIDKNELQAFLEQIKQIEGDAKAKELGLVRVVGKAMENAMDRARRMAQLNADTKNADAGEPLAAKNLAEAVKAKAETSINRVEKYLEDSPAAEQARKAAKDAEKLLETLSSEDRLKVAAKDAGENVAKGLKFGENKDADTFMKQDNKSSDKSWNDFFQKLKLADSESVTTLKADNAKGFADALNTTKADLSSTKPWARTAAPQIIKQVDQAILKSLTGGGKRLTLQLSPEHLGSINVALTVKNSEVSATIRADNHEVARIITDQLESLRQSLEDQGLKVSKLEVQTQLPNHDNSSWQGMANQNKNFERDVLNRMRARMGNSIGDGGEALAQEMNSMAREAILSGNGNGLHVIA